VPAGISYQSGLYFLITLLIYRRDVIKWPVMAVAFTFVTYVIHHKLKTDLILSNVKIQLLKIFGRKAHKGVTHNSLRNVDE